jgi:hypothetical protein
MQEDREFYQNDICEKCKNPHFVILHNGVYIPLRKEYTNPLFVFKIKQSLQQVYYIPSPSLRADKVSVVIHLLRYYATQSVKYFKFLD